jgi:hypothetical protein
LYPISEWAHAFVTRFDDLAPIGRIVFVTAAQTLAILQQVLQSQGVPAATLLLVPPS